MTARICNKCNKEFDTGKNGVNCECQKQIIIN